MWDFLVTVLVIGVFLWLTQATLRDLDDYRDF